MFEFRPLAFIIRRRFLFLPASPKPLEPRLRCSLATFHLLLLSLPSSPPSSARAAPAASPALAVACLCSQLSPLRKQTAPGPQNSGSKLGGFPFRRPLGCGFSSMSCPSLLCGHEGQPQGRCQQLGGAHMFTGRWFSLQGLCRPGCACLSFLPPAPVPVLTRPAGPWGSLDQRMGPLQLCHGPPVRAFD